MLSFVFEAMRYVTINCKNDNRCSHNTSRKAYKNDAERHGISLRQTVPTPSFFTHRWDGFTVSIFHGTRFAYRMQLVYKPSLLWRKKQHKYQLWYKFPRNLFRVDKHMFSTCFLYLQIFLFVWNSQKNCQKFTYNHVSQFIWPILVLSRILPFSRINA